MRDGRFRKVIEKVFAVKKSYGKPETVDFVWMVEKILSLKCNRSLQRDFILVTKTSLQKCFLRICLISEPSGIYFV